KTGRDDEAIAFLDKHLADKTLPAPGRRELFFLRGKIHEKRGEYDEAFAAYRSANETAGGTCDADAYRRRIDELLEVYRRENLPRYARATLSLEDPVFIVGMPRTGSTLVERIIDAHPAARGLGELAEMNRITRGLPLSIGSPLPYPQCVRDLTPPVADRIGTEYVESVRKTARRARRVVDKYLPNFENLGLLSLILPQARVIECRRNPMDACLSCFAEPLHPSGHPWASRLEDLGAHHRQYERIMDHWKNVLDMPILEVSYEELTADQEAVSRRIIEFLGLPWDEQCLRYYELKRPIMTLSREQVDKPVYRSSVNRADRFGDHLEPLRRALAIES
ncbi:MAG: sulfotransferase, partial [Planctomycetota bacterium]|nr:sulfotransferase [Planctomycetota bacterium]